MAAELTLATLKEEARTFARQESFYAIPLLYGIDNGKTVGTFVEAQLHQFPQSRYSYVIGNAASDIDFPELGVDVKVSPQSSGAAGG